MQEKDLFEYTVIRVVPRVERGEFLNVGVIVYCSAQNFLKTLFKVDEARLQAISNELDVDELKTRLNAFTQICAGGDNAGPIGKLPIASRFRWLSAARSTIIQTSPIHPGLCIDAHDVLARLYAQLVE
jgi:hypothetical protein